MINTTLNIAILGYGTVGSGVVHILNEQKQQLKQLTGYDIKINYVLVRDKSKYTTSNEDSFIVTDDINDIFNDQSIDIMIEVMGSVYIAHKYIKRALENNINVVTANKDLIALYGEELQTLASQNKCDLFYEAAVAGGIPILRTMVNSLSVDHISDVLGIVNGTTNFILTKMTTEGLDYDEALEQAQELGFAELDPTNDVDGLDAARKMVILARLAFKTQLSLDSVATQGIRQIKKSDMLIAQQLGYTIKLIGRAIERENKVAIEVSPTLVKHTHPLASVNNEYNAILIKGASVGETIFYGAGAGSLPTATSVISDIVAVANNKRLGVSGQQVNMTEVQRPLLQDNQILCKYFINLSMLDTAGQFANMTTILSQKGISIEQILQQPSNKTGYADVYIVTHQTSKASFNECIKDLNATGTLTVEMYYHVEE